MKINSENYVQQLQLHNEEALLYVVKKISRAQKKQTNWKATLVAASLCFALGIGGISAAAATGLLPVPKTFQTIFGLNSTKKMKVANNMGGVVGVSATDKGYKINAEGILKDDDHIKIVYKIEKSDGSSLGEEKQVCTGVDFDYCGVTSWQSGSLETVEQDFNSQSVLYCTSWDILDTIDSKKQLKAFLGDMILQFDKKRVAVKGTWNFLIPTTTWLLH